MKFYLINGQSVGKIKRILPFIFFLTTAVCYGQKTGQKALTPIKVDTKNLLVTVDATNCRWSAEVKGTEMKMNDIYFLPGDDPCEWKVVSSVNNNDSGNLGSFVTVTLHGTKPGQLDFDYRISVSKNTNDILVSLDRTNKTGKPVDIDDMNYFVSRDVRLGGTNDKWISMGTMSQFEKYYELIPVINLIVPRTYQVNHVISSSVKGNSLLMGHVTAFKGASRFDVRSGWQGKIPDRMQVRGYCSYKITVPEGKSFTGEKLLICFNTDAIRAMEHQGDMIAISHDVRLRERKPIDINDRDLVSGNYSRFHGWMSGGNNTFAKKFFQENGLSDFYWGLDGRGGTMGIYGLGGYRGGRPNIFPTECYLPINTVEYGIAKVLDFSNPLTIKLEHDRAFQTVTGFGKNTGRIEMDYCKMWDAWPGQFNTFMSGLETYRAGIMPWREAIDQNAPKMVIRSANQPIDYSYGVVDICRISEDADRGYEDRGSFLNLGGEFTGLFAEAILGSANRFFYNGRVYWNDCDGFHIYKWALTGSSPAIDKADFTASQGKVDACFHAIAGNTLYLSDALNVPYPADRIELLKRISPPTMDVSYPVDLFVRRPAQVWNMPIERPFGKWSVLTVFNYSAKTDRKFTATLDAAKDLRLDSTKEYIVYEFWTKQLVGTFIGKFVSRPVSPCDCEIYSIVEKQNRPVLISTSRNIRQMAFDIKDLVYDDKQQMLRGVSRAVAGDPYQLRFYVPEGFTMDHVELTEGLIPSNKMDGNLLTVDYNSTTGKDVEWKIFFKATK